MVALREERHEMICLLVMSDVIQCGKPMKVLFIGYLPCCVIISVRKERGWRQGGVVGPSGGRCGAAVNSGPALWQLTATPLRNPPGGIRPKLRHRGKTSVLVPSSLLLCVF